MANGSAPPILEVRDLHLSFGKVKAMDKEFYLGLSQAGQRRGYREVKHYRRRKRWL